MNQGSNNKKSPDVSIDEALEMFLGLSFPGGIPEDVDKEQLYAILRQKIAKDRPEWAEKSGVNNAADDKKTDRYSELKKAIFDKSNQPELPEDPEERYLYERRQEALANLAAKKADELEEAKKRAIRQKLLDLQKEKDSDLDFIRGVVPLQPEEENRTLSKLQRPEFSDQSQDMVLDNSNMSLSLDEKDANERQLDFLRKVETLDREGRVAAMRAFNESRRKMIGTKKSALKPRDSFDFNGDERFSMDTDAEPKRSGEEDEFLNYLHKKRTRSRMEISGKKSKGLSLE